MGQEVLNVGGFHKLETAALDKRNIVPRQLQFQVEGMETRPKQDRDVPERYAFLAQLQNLLTDEAGLHLFALGLDQNGGLTLLFVGKESLVIALLGALDDVIRQIQNGLRAAVVFLKFDDASSRKRLREIHDVAEIGAAKGIDTLGVVAHNGYIIVRSGQQPNNPGLKIISVLILVDHDEPVNLGKTAAYLFLVAEQIFQLG